MLHVAVTCDNLRQVATISCRKERQVVRMMTYGKLLQVATGYGRWRQVPVDDAHDDAINQELRQVTSTCRK